MKDSSRILSALSAKDLTDDKLDELFDQLEEFQPPESVLKNIMATVSQLPPFSSPYPSLEELALQNKRSH